MVEKTGKSSREIYKSISDKKERAVDEFIDAVKQSIGSVSDQNKKLAAIKKAFKDIEVADYQKFKGESLYQNITNKAFEVDKMTSTDLKKYRKVIGDLVEEHLFTQEEHLHIPEQTEETKTQFTYGGISHTTSQIKHEQKRVETKQMMLEALKEVFSTQIGKNIAKTNLFSQGDKELSSKIVSGQSLNEKELEKADVLILKLEKSEDQTIKQKIIEFATFFEKILEKKYETDSNLRTNASGIPLQQGKNLKTGQNLSSSSAVNAGQLPPIQQKPQPPQIYDAISGRIYLTPEEQKVQFERKKLQEMAPEQIKAQKELFLKEAFYTIRNLPPEQKLKAEQILKTLEHYYKLKEKEAHLEQASTKISSAFRGLVGRKRFKEAKEAKNISDQKKQIQEQIDELTRQLQEASGDQAQFIEEAIGLHRQKIQALEHLEQKNPGGIRIRADEEEKKELHDDGVQKTREEIIQEQAMISTMNKGSNQANITSTDIQKFRDPGAAYNEAHLNFTDLKPLLQQVLQEASKQDNLTKEQLQLAKAVLEQGEDNIPELLSQINFLRSKFAEVPLTTKEQQRIRNESEEILRKVGSSQMFYPYNEKTIQVLQTKLTEYIDEKGEKIQVPFTLVSKKHLEEKQKEILTGQKQKENGQEFKMPEGKLEVKDIVKFIHQLSKYASKIEGDIDLSNTDLPKYKFKTTIFTPQIKKIEDTKFNFTAESAFRLRPC